MWVWSWKREIGLGFDSALPPYRIDVDGEVAEFSIGRDEARQVLWRARRAGTRLDLEETTALRRLETNDDDLHTVLCSLAWEWGPTVGPRSLRRTTLNRGFGLDSGTHCSWTPGRVPDWPTPG